MEKIFRVIPMGRILAIDYGKKKVGFAVTDESQTVISNLPQFLNDNTFWTNLENLIKKTNPELIIIGYPATELEILSTSQKIIISFRKKLESLVSIPIQFQDESYTSKAAEEIYVISKGKKKTSLKKIHEKKQKIDSLAAHLILKSYLNIY